MHMIQINGWNNKKAPYSEEYQITSDAANSETIQINT
jgi:hypothetical protein